MAQVIQHKRGSLENLKNVNPVFRGEVLLATGSLNVHSSEFGTVSQPIEIQFIGGLNDYEPVTKFFTGSGLPSITTGTYGDRLDGIVWYDSTRRQQYELNATVTNDAATSAIFTGSHIAISPEVSADGQGVIGTPSDTTYTDGFFDTFTPATTIGNAIDEISEAFLDLAPAKAKTLTGQSLTKNSPSTFTGRLAGGLPSADWYVGTTAYSNVSTLTSATSVDLRSPDQTETFRAGKSSSLSANTLEGGVSSSIISGSTPEVFSKRAFDPDGEGITGNIRISDLDVYNTFWAKANARIEHTLTSTGSYKYKILADGAGETNVYQLWYLGSGTNYPNISVTAQSPVTSSTSFNYLSGITYLAGATFDLAITGSDLFYPIYETGNVHFNSTNFSANLATGSQTSDQPQYNDILELDVQRSLKQNINTAQSSPTGTVTVEKPGKSDASATYTLTQMFVNSYTSADNAGSTNSGNSHAEAFLHESHRLNNLQGGVWNSQTTLSDGNLESQNGKLIAGKFGSTAYSGFVDGTNVDTDYAIYFRRSDPSSDNRQNGTFTISRNTNAFASSTPISPWDYQGANPSDAVLQVSLILSADVTGAQTTNAVYDLGRSVGDNSGIIKGIRNTITTNNSTSYTVTWALPSGINTGAAASGYVIVWIRYKGTSASDYLNNFSITYS